MNCRSKKKKLISQKQDQNIQEKSVQVGHEQEIRKGVAATTLSEMNSLEKISQKLKENNEISSAEQTQQKEAEDFIPVNKEKFEVAWQDYLINEISKNQHNLAVILKRKPPEVLIDGSVQFVFPNSALLDMFQKERIKFADFLSEKYQIRGLRLHLVTETLSDNEKAVYMTSPREIFEFMAQKNPEISKLSNLLKLIPD